MVAEEIRTLADQTQHSLNHITLATKTMADQMQEVSSASEQISAGCEQVNASVTELEDIAKMAYTESRGMVSIVDEQIQIVQQVTDSTTSMYEVTLDLNKRISEYKV